MDTALIEGFKAKGTELYLKGDRAGAEEQYGKGVIAASGSASGDWRDAAKSVIGGAVTIPAEVNSVTSLLLSNLSQVMFDIEDLELSALAADAAVKLDNKLVKGWFRLTRALQTDRRSFHALTVLLRDFMPVLKSTTKPSEMRTLLNGLDEKVPQSCGITDLSSAFGLAPHAGGVGAVALSRLTEEKVIFVESMCSIPNITPDPNVLLATDPPPTQDAVVLHFADQLVKVVDGGKAEEWSVVVKELEGSWPRKIEEVPESILVRAKENFAEKHPKFSEKHGPAVAEDVVYRALQCRYNCFHAGFFRACALINHSCCPNAAMKVDNRDPSKPPSVHLTTVKPISAGETISVKYLTDMDYVMGAGPRRASLFVSWLFHCDCQRCADDCDPEKAAEGSESVLCSSCGSYVHLPMPADESWENGDPLIPREVKCLKCNEVNSWTEENRQIINKVIKDSLASSQNPIPEFLASNVLESRRQVEKLVHPRHWIHRVVLYVYCQCMLQHISNAWRIVAQTLDEMYFKEAIDPMLRHFGYGPRSTPGEGTGGDLLLCLCDLWSLIEPFYPAAQAYHLHMTICKLVAFNLLQRSNPNALSIPAACKLLTKHAACLVQEERRGFLRRVQASGMPEADLKLIRRALN